MATAITADDFEFEIEAGGLDLEGIEEAAVKPTFPILIVWIALIKDGFDVLTFGLATYISTPVLGIIILFWMLGKGSFMKKMMRKIVAKRIKNWAIKKSIPILSIWPWTTTFVLMIHFEETKIVKVLDSIIETAYNNKDLGLQSIIEKVYKKRSDLETS